MASTNKQHKLWWQSSYDRGLDMLLYIWSDIKTMYPNATLDCAYGWDLFDVANRTNPERMEWKARVQAMMNQPGITHHGRIGKEELAKLRKKCGIWAYPTHFKEINCIGALESQYDGLVPVVTNLAALQETVGSGIKVDGDIKDPKVLEEYKNQLLSLMGDTEKWEKESKKAQKFAKSYKWSQIAKEWIKVFKTP